MIETEQEENILFVTAIGTVTGEDYETILVPVLESMFSADGKVRMLYKLGEDFTGYTAAAMWDDAKVGMKHLTDFEKIAVVSDVDWIRGAVRVFGFAIPCPVKVFSDDESSDAHNWIRAQGD